MGKDTGNLYIKSFCGSTESSSISIDDLYKYDDCSTDKSSNYTCSANSSLVFDTDHYIFSNATTGDKLCTVATGLTGNYRFEAIMKLPNRNGGLYHNGELPTYLTNYGRYSKTILAHGNGWQVVKEVNTVINATDYYKYILISNNGTISVEIQTLDGTSLFTSSWSTSVSSQQFAILCQDPTSTNQQILIKEIKIKKL